MTAPKVLNKRKTGVVLDAVYIGTREEVIAKHRAWLLAQPAKIEAVKRELKGRDLLCFCAPKPCHGDTLLEIANQ